MTRRRKVPCAGALPAAISSAAMAQVAGGFDPTRRPETRGVVAQYSLSPRGDVDGLILTDGLQAPLPPQLGTQLVFAIRPGDAASVRRRWCRPRPS